MPLVCTIKGGREHRTPAGDPGLELQTARQPPCSPTIPSYPAPHFTKRWHPRVGLFRRFINTMIAQLSEKPTGADNFVQDLVPIPTSPDEVLAEALVDASHLAATHFLSECLLRLFVGGARAKGRWSVSQWDVEPRCGWVTSALANFTVGLWRCVPCLKTLRRDDLFPISPPKSFNSFWIIRNFSFLLLFFTCRRAAA